MDYFHDENNSMFPHVVGQDSRQDNQHEKGCGTYTDHPEVPRHLTNLYFCKENNHEGDANFKNSYLFENLPVQTKIPILSRRTILLAIHLAHNNYFTSQHTVLSTQQHAYQSVLVTSWFDSICVTVTCWVKFREKNIYIDMNYSYLTTMYESIFAQIYIFW